jgi:hypothetical protein
MIPTIVMLKVKYFFLYAFQFTLKDTASQRVR